MFSLPAAIKTEIERAYGYPLKYPADCHRLALSIRNSLNETIGVTTLKRILGFVSDVKEPRLSTLDILAKYCGFSDYDEMKRKVADGGDSDFEKDPDILSTSLAPGSIIGFEYLPDRKVTLRYIGNAEFEVLASEKGSLRKGDIVSVSCFIDGLPLIVSRVVRDGSDLGRYIAGKVSGIMNLYLDKPSEIS